MAEHPDATAETGADGVRDRTVAAGDGAAADAAVAGDVTSPPAPTSTERRQPWRGNRSRKRYGPSDFEGSVELWLT